MPIDTSATPATVASSAAADALAGGPRPLAALPMYDWPEVRAASDALWRATREALIDAGLAADAVPFALERTLPAVALWRSPRLLLGQTCGLPLVQSLVGRVTLVGTFDFGLDGCPPGRYRSVLVVRADDPRDSLAGFLGARAAVNDIGSQSGCHALIDAIGPFADGPRFFAELTLSGAHRESIRTVAAGAADIAAIDAASWRLACRHEPAARALRVLGHTPPMPAPPLITARPADERSDAESARAARLADALGHAIAALDATTCDTLGFHGVRHAALADYAVLNAPASVATLAAYGHLQEAQTLSNRSEVPHPPARPPPSPRR